MVLRVVSSYRMQATRASFFGFPAARTQVERTDHRVPLGGHERELVYAATPPPHYCDRLQLRAQALI